jgi:predicted nucleic acid-binding protein
VEALNKPTIYLETSVFGNYLDVDHKFHKQTDQFFAAIDNGLLHCFTSDYVIDELANTPNQIIRFKLLSIIQDYNLSIIPRKQDYLDLAKFYLYEHVLPEKFLYDAIHIACATLNNIDYLLTFNFRHIIKTKDMTAKINLRKGYPAITICTPSEVLNL